MAPASGEEEDDLEDLDRESDDEEDDDEELEDDFGLDGEEGAEGVTLDDFEDFQMTAAECVPCSVQRRARS